MSDAGRDAAAMPTGNAELIDDLARAQRMVGRILDDKFRLRSCIGIGGSGAVYKADQIALGRTVAVKILAEELTRDARLVKRFHDEALHQIGVLGPGSEEPGPLCVAGIGRHRES